jgi:ATP adenylyltransferase
MCIFCDRLKSQKEFLLENQWCFAITDAYPVSHAHALIIPKRHVKSVFQLKPDELTGMFSLTKELKSMLDALYKPKGYNIGFNLGKTAGQSIMHCHMHLIPRYQGDVKNPRGGIRGVIPGKQDYK